jgi:prepilin-type N-terminal cleavage/methylation domain-containing protein
MPKSARPGFTLIEMLIVVSVVGLLAALALPRLRAAAFDADAGMRALQSVLQQAQRLAIVRQTDVMVSFDTANARVRIVYDGNSNHQFDSGEEVHWKALEPADRFLIPPSGVHMVASAAVVGNNLATRDNLPTVYYHRDGGVSSELELYLSSHRTDRSDIRALHVRQATGRVQVYRYTGSAWLRAGL